MRKEIGIIIALLFYSGALFSQSQLDAYKFAQSDLNGTARYLGMGGAFGALGGDISAMHTNPAGLAVYKSSEVVTTLSLSGFTGKTNWYGNKLSENRTRLSFDNMAYVGYFPTSNSDGLTSWNVGFSYNKVKNFRRSYRMAARGNSDFSITDYMANRATLEGVSVSQLTASNAYNSGIDWLSILGHSVGAIEPYNNGSGYYSAFGQQNSDGWENYLLDDSQLEVHESGAIDQYNISFGLNFSDVVLFGASLAVTDINYNYSSYYSEDFAHEGNYFDLANGLSTDGTGYGFNLGVIFRPADFLRLGVAYTSPTWYKMTDYYYGDADIFLTYIDEGQQETVDNFKGTPDGAASKYEYRSPDKFLFSIAGVIGNKALVSVDYELVNYKNMKNYYENGVANDFANENIRSTFGIGNTIRAGVEYKFTPRLAGRLGGAWSMSPVKSDWKNGDIEVLTVGTIPHYTFDRGISNYTVGLGYRFTPNFYTDIAYVFTQQKEDAYAFSPTFDSNGDVMNDSQPALLKTNRNRIALTFGYKF
ncbi:MAG: outer membrane protein transport protein [Tannerellaceae bacterium]|nr:outer membrane protein transport protein [Tannerellaceae bacterium]